MKYTKLMNKFLCDYYCALKNRPSEESTYLSDNDHHKVPNDITTQEELKNRKVGYIVATCSPPTKAHMELADKAISDLGLDVLYFIIWPFYHIHGFHSDKMESWIKEQKHYPYETRIMLLMESIKDFGNEKIKILQNSKSWYIESEKEFSAEDQKSFFKTGSWYVIRKLQAEINSIMGGVL